MINFNAIKEYCSKTNTCKLKNMLHFSPGAQEVKMAEQEADGFFRSGLGIKSALQKFRDSYLEQNPNAFMTLDHIKSNYDNGRIMHSVKGQTKELQAVSTEDFCNLSEIMKNIKQPFELKVFRAMEPRDFNIGRLSPEEFFSQYYHEGKEVVIPIYMASSFDKNVAYRFANKKPDRFIINLKVDKNVPGVYMENLCPGDGEVYLHEQEFNIIKNAKVVLNNLRETVNPWDNRKIYEIDGHVKGFINVAPDVKPAYKMDAEDLELLSALKEFININK